MPRAVVLTAVAAALVSIGVVPPGPADATAAADQDPRTTSTSGVPDNCPVPPPTVQQTGPGDVKTVALTFDDGPGPSTAATLRILMRYGVRATFFDVGVHMKQDPQMVLATAAQGHLVGDHTWDHAQLPTLPATDQQTEIDSAAAEQKALLGSSPCVFRPPYGAYNDDTVTAANRDGMTVWFWTTATYDYEANGSSSAYWVNRIVGLAEIGLQLKHPVLLMHNGPAPGDPPNSAGNPATVRALPAIIAAYRAHGYQFVDLLGRSGLTPYAPTGAASPAIAATVHGQHVLVSDHRGRLLESTLTRGHWTRLLPVKGATGRGGASAVAVSPWTMAVAITDASQHVRLVTIGDHRTPRFESLGGSVASRPATAYDALRRVLAVAVRTPSGSVAIRRRVAGRWTSWTDLGGSFVTAPALAFTRDGALTVATVDARGRVETRRLPHTRTTLASSRWHVLDGTITSDPALSATPNGRGLVLAARSVTGSMLRRVRAVGGSWGGWASMHGTWASGAAAAIVHGALEIAAIGTDGRVRIARRASEGVTGRWSGWRPTSVTALILG